MRWRCAAGPLPNVPAVPVARGIDGSIVLNVIYLTLHRAPAKGGSNGAPGRVPARRSFLCTRAGSPVVAKVFVKSGAADEDAELFGALAALDATNRTLASLPPSRVLRLVPPLEVVLTDSAVVQVRQYAFSTVYDRLSTRPFLSGVGEGRQLLPAQQQTPPYTTQQQ